MAASSAKITYAEDLGTEVISVYVGPDRRRFVVHKQLLTSQSDYFDKALNGRFKEAEENEIHLEEDDPTAIGLMVGWLYRGVIPGTGNKASPFTRAICTSNENNQWLGPPLFPQSGTSVPFTPFLASEPGAPQNRTDAFINICCHQNYRDFSQEELRLSDYRLNRKFASDAPVPPQTMAPVVNTTSSGLSLFRGSSIFRPPSSGWGNIMPQLPGAQPPPNTPSGASLSGSQAPPPQAPGGTQPPSQSPGLFGTLTSGAQTSVLQMPLPPQPSLFSTPNQPALQTGSQNAPTANIFASGGASSLFGRPAGNPSSTGVSSSIFNLSGAPSGSGTIRNTGMSIFGNLPAVNVQNATSTAPAKPAPKKPGEFGYSPTINYPKPDGAFIEGIPRSEPLGDRMVDENVLQDALLHLCIFAETVCWPKLFNTAIDAYMISEQHMHRNILLEHVDLIYSRTHPDSTLREFVMDSIRNLSSPDSYKAYMEIAQQHEDFLANLLKNFSVGAEAKNKKSMFGNTKSYFMSEEPFTLSKKAFPRNDDEL